MRTQILISIFPGLLGVALGRTINCFDGGGRGGFTPAQASRACDSVKNDITVDPPFKPVGGTQDQSVAVHLTTSQHCDLSGMHDLCVAIVSNCANTASALVDGKFVQGITGTFDASCPHWSLQLHRDGSPVNGK